MARDRIIYRKVEADEEIVDWKQYDRFFKEGDKLVKRIRHYQHENFAREVKTYLVQHCTIVTGYQLALTRMSLHRVAERLNSQDLATRLEDLLKDSRIFVLEMSLKQ